APYVGSDVGRMVSDARERRGELPVYALSLVAPPHARPVAGWIRARVAEYVAAGGHLHSSASGAAVPHDAHPHAHSHG
ncbi:MAG: urease accessory protein, partial [bacterium]